MRHLAHMLVFAAMLGVFFAALLGSPGRRLRVGLIIWGVLIGAALALSLLMYPAS